MCEISFCGKNSEFKIVETLRKKKSNYDWYGFLIECVKCKKQRIVTQTFAKVVTCTDCKKENYIQNYLGKTIGSLKILSYAYLKDDVRHFYNTECIKCGHKKITSLAAIKNSIKGCRKCNKAGKTPKIESQISHYKKAYITGAKKRKINFDLSEDEFKTLIFSNCYYCGDSPKERLSSKLRTIPEFSFKTNGIDRKDSQKGYTVDNTVSCCEMCNRMKMAYTQENFLKKIKEIFNNLQL